MARFNPLIVCLLAALAAGCVDDSRDTSALVINQDSTSDDSVSDESATEFDRSALMTNIVDTIVIPNYKNTADSAHAFAKDSGVLATYCSAIGTDAEALAKADAKVGWRSLMDEVQKTEMHIFGPAQINEESLHNRVHSYINGTTATCGIDQAVILANDDDYNVVNRAFNQRGVGAIEYLLFNENLNHSCASQVQTTSGWNELSDSARKTQRCSLSLMLSEDIAVASTLIHDSWTSEAEPFRDAFLDPTQLGDNFQLMTDALFYIETFSKSQKLTIPLGIDDKCTSLTCSELIESPYSETSLRNLEINADEFLTIFNGGEGLGFDDLIVDEGFADITQRFQTQLADVNERINGSTDSLVDQIGKLESAGTDTDCINAFANPDSQSSYSACSVAGLIKKVTDDLKIEFVTIVGVAIPGRVQSDND